MRWAMWPDTRQSIMERFDMATRQQEKFIAPVLAPDLQRRQMDLQRNQLMAQQLLQSEAPQGQMVSGHYVAPSITQHLAHALRQYQGNKAMNDLPQQAADLQQAQQQHTLSQFGFGQPSPQQYAAALSGGDQAQAFPVGDQPQPMGQQGGQGAMVLPGMSEQQSMAILQNVGPQKYSELLAQHGTHRGTSAMQNAVAMGLQPGQPEYNAYIQRVTGSPQTIVNVGGDSAPGLGKLSSDYGYVLDPETRQPVIDSNTGLPQAAPVPGSPAARSIASAEEKAAGAQRQKARAGATVVQDLQRALDDRKSTRLNSSHVASSYGGF